MTDWKRIALWGTALAALLAVAACQEEGGDPALQSEAAASETPAGTVSPPLAQSASGSPAGAGVSPGPAVNGTKSAAWPEGLEKHLQSQLLTPLGFAPADGSKPATLQVEGLELPFLEMENSYRDMFNAVRYSLKGVPFRVENRKGAVLLETDTTNPKSFRLAKMGGTSYFFERESIRKYQPVGSRVPPASLNSLLQAGLDGRWKPGSLAAALGKPDSIFDGFDIYFRQHVEVEEDQILSTILFRKEYARPVIGTLGTGSTREEIEALLGTPPFEMKEPNPVFGYKLEPFYLFFAGDGPPYDISVYPRSFTGSTGGPELNELAAGSMEGNSANEPKTVDALREEWSDYRGFNNSRGSYGITYPHRGVWADTIFADMDGDDSFIQIYGNYEGQLTEDIRLPRDADRLKALADSPDWPAALSFYRFRLQEDLVFNQEKVRLADERFIREETAKSGVPSPNGSMIAKAKDNTTFEHAGLYLFYPNGDRPSREVPIGNFIWNIGWLSDRYVIFEGSFRGIVGYDTALNKLIDIKTTEDYSDQYRLVEVKDGVIRYTDGDAEKALPYSFNDRGELVLPQDPG